SVPIDLPEEIDTVKAASQPVALEPASAIQPAAATELVDTPRVPVETLAEPRPPLIQMIAIPQTLPPDVLRLLKRASFVEGSVRPAAGTMPVKGAPAWAKGGSPVHGALAPRQAIVYVLDMSGSMGEWGKFDAARRALIATLRMQPESVRFQVVVYSGTANVPLRGAPGECLPATARNVERTIAALQTLAAPAGHSNHVEGVRIALAFRPNHVLLFTDSDDLPLSAFRGLLHQAEKPADLSVAKVGASVEKPIPLK
ncbi:MAG TPA: vWA domain-containing protein, partial [Urbifossiella sp.]